MITRMKYVMFKYLHLIIYCEWVSVIFICQIQLLMLVYINATIEHSQLLAIFWDSGCYSYL